MQHKTRPERISIVAELGEQRTLAGGAAQFDRLGNGPNVLFLGLGPDPAELESILPDNANEHILYIEAPQLSSAMLPQWHEAIPAHWEQIRPEDITAGLVRSCTIFLYKQNPRLYPGFWGPVTARVRLALLRAGADAVAQKPEVWIPAADNALLVQELAHAFEQAGLAVELIDPKTAHEQVPAMLGQRQPALYFSINLAGLDIYGELYQLLCAAGVPVVTWCVDNPLHLLSGQKSPYWKDMPFFCTDDWFESPLKRMGLQQFHHLPLAAWKELCTAPKTTDKELQDRIVFVGRSAFPDKKGFFSGVQLDDALYRQARHLLSGYTLPDFEWWIAALGLSFETLWPGRAVRAAGLGADECSRLFRRFCLEHASRTGQLTIHGDDEWQRLNLPDTQYKGFVDYYGPLMDVYASALMNLNVTSLLLPHGLTQRNFDVWACGGFLLTDRNPGLDIFPEELVRAVSYDHPAEIPVFHQAISSDSTLRQSCIDDWKTLILNEHTYEKRIEHVLLAIGARKNRSS